MRKTKVRFALFNILFAIILVAVIAINVVAVNYSTALELFFGSVGGEQGESYENEDELLAAEIAFTDTVVDEGSVLMYNNENALPLDSGASVSIFSQSCREWITNGTGSSSVATSEYSDRNLKTSLESAGFTVNETLWDFYGENGQGRGTGGSGQAADWSLNENPWSEVEAACGDSFADYSDAAVMIISRTGGEGADVPREMSRYDGTADEHYLELSSTEKEILRGIQDAGFEKTVVIINAGNAMEMSFLDEEDLGVDAVLWVGGTGYNGVEEVGKLLSGEVNPSGHLVDTYVNDSFSSPAMQNFGDNRYMSTSGEVLDSGYSYVNYGEGVYVGYRYYETRYEDVVMGTPNVGEYNYSEVVRFPFGYGLSYTDFTWSDFTFTENEDGTVTASVNVTNSGDRAGKDAVEIYFQAPYTQYDQENGIEKPAVVLGGFAKTGMLDPGASETVEVTFDAQDVMKSYSVADGAYILDEGDYYITAAQDAHEAVNNVLAAKGYTAADGMDADGNADMTAVYNVGGTQMITTDLATGAEIANRFDDAVAEGATYLSRMNWSVMDNGGLTYGTGTAEGVSYSTDAAGTVNTVEASDELIGQIDATGWDASGRPEEANDTSPATVDTDSGLTLEDLAGADYDDENWQALIEQMKVSELHLLYQKAGFVTQEVESIDKPKTTDSDGPHGITNFISGYSCFGYPIEEMLASTWNVDLATRYGEFIGEDGIRSNTQGWYAPAMNIHRTPFSGRNHEYYSEDPILSGRMGAATVQGAMSKGMYCYIKHFAVNDQETNRSSVCTWAQEQAIREIYLRPFEITVKDGGATGVMASMNRIGFRQTKGSYALLTETLRNEWGFQGAVITDYTSEGDAVADQCLAAGTDLQLNTGSNRLTDTASDYVRHALQDAAHHVGYMVVNSTALTTAAASGFPVYILILIVLDVVAALGIAGGEVLVIRSNRRIIRGLDAGIVTNAPLTGTVRLLSIAALVVDVIGLVIEIWISPAGIAIAAVGLICAIIAKVLAKKQGSSGNLLVRITFIVAVICMILVLAYELAIVVATIFSERDFG